MAKFSPPPIRNKLVEKDTDLVTFSWIRWFNELFEKIKVSEDVEARPHMLYTEKVLSFSELSGMSKAVIETAATPTAKYKVREILLSADGGFGGGQGDRTISIKDSSGTVVYSILPSAAVRAPTSARWGDTDIPFPTVANHIFKETTAGENLIAQYIGGSTDYISGSITLLVVMDRTARL